MRYRGYKDFAPTELTNRFPGSNLITRFLILCLRNGIAATNEVADAQN